MNTIRRALVKYEILDTQIISYAAKKHGTYDVRNKHISSVTAQEFLLMRDQATNKPLYHVPLASRLHMPLMTYSRPFLRDHSFTRNLTDRIILEFGLDHPSIIEYGHRAISQFINSKSYPSFCQSISFLPKEQQKTIRGRFTFLLDNNIECLPLAETAAKRSFDLLSSFCSEFNPKGNIRNTINDILILSSTLDLCATLVTEDSVLNRFAVRYLDGIWLETNGVIQIDFSTPDGTTRSRLSESKGYINRAWRARFQNYHGKP